jgi:DNA polymerase III subunit alpha
VTLAKAVPPLPDAPAWSEIEQLNFEHEALGVFWSGHPIDSHAADLREFGARTIAELAPGEGVADPPLEGTMRRPLPKSGDDVVVAGIISGVRPLKTRKGDRMGVFTLEDRQGGIEVVVYTEPFARFERLIENGGLVVVRGRLDKDEEEARVYASDIAPIESVRERLARELAITMAVRCSISIGATSRSRCSSNSAAGHTPCVSGRRCPRRSA